MSKRCCADAFDQQHFSALVADEVDHDAAQRRAGRAHRGVQQEAPGIGIGISRHNGVERHAEEGRINGGESQYAPDAQRLQQRQDQQAPFVEEMFQNSGQLSVASCQLSGNVSPWIKRHRLDFTRVDAVLNDCHHDEASGRTRDRLLCGRCSDDSRSIGVLRLRRPRHGTPALRMTQLTTGSITETPSR